MPTTVSQRRSDGADADTPANRVLPGPMSASHRLVDDADGKALSAIAGVEVAARRKARRIVEKYPVRTSRHVADASSPGRGSGRPSGWMRKRHASPASGRWLMALDRGDAGDRRHGPGDAIEVLKTRGVVGGTAERQGERQEVARVESGVDVLEPQERAAHQTGSGQQRERKHELETEQPAAQLTGARAFGRSTGIRLAASPAHSHVTAAAPAQAPRRHRSPRSAAPRNAATAPSSASSSCIGRLAAGSNAPINPSAQVASSRPTMPPAALRARLSASICHTSRPRPAPRAARTASSFCLADPRTS